MQEGLQALLKGRTSFIIAHRLSTIKNCDRILYISNKGIAESGSHDELMEQKGHYYQLYTAQLEEVKQANIKLSSQPHRAESDERLTFLCN